MVVVDPEAELRRLMRLCIQRLEREPGDPDALFVKAAILAQLGLYPAALHWLDRVASRQAGYPGIHEFRARLWTEMGRRSP